MKLLIITQVVDTEDPVMGFFAGWIAEFAKQAEHVEVICLKEGRHAFPAHVAVHSLGKVGTEHSIRARMRYLIRFFSLIWRLRAQYDAVFVHMNQIYVLLGWPFWKAWGKRIGLWYSHKSITVSLMAARVLTDVIFTPARKGFPLPSHKVHITGQGIDMSVFKPADASSVVQNEVIRIITVGRIAPIKDYGTLVDAIAIVAQAHPAISVTVLGGPGEKDQEYYENILSAVEEKGLSTFFTFVGPVPNLQTPKYLRESDLFVNMGHTGGMDKAVIEAMACGLPVLTCNEVFVPMLSPFGLLYEKKDSRGLADKILWLTKDELQRKALGASLREIAVRDHSLDRLITKILDGSIPYTH
jgi:glycosyltransferase involved in cell wall biosynthesis